MSQQTLNPLISAPREQYLRKNESRIREAAAEPFLTDPQITKHITGLHMADELQQLHQKAAAAHHNANRTEKANDHLRYTAWMIQFRLLHLDALANLLI